MQNVYLLQMFTGAHSTSVFSSLQLAKAAYCAHCAAMGVAQPTVFKQQFETVWYAANTQCGAITDISITEIVLNAPAPFV